MFLKHFPCLKQVFCYGKNSFRKVETITNQILDFYCQHDICCIDEQKCFYFKFIIRRLLEYGADLSPDSYDQLTPLMALCSTSASHGSDETEFEARLVRCADILFKAGKVDVNARQTQKMTALM